MAQQPETWPVSWLDQKTMTGDWGGARTSLEEAGVKPRALWVTESAANPSDGRSHGARYTQQIDFGADLDPGRLAGLAGGSIRITLTDRAGRSLSADAIGNLLTVQEVFGGGHRSVGRRVLGPSGAGPFRALDSAALEAEPCIFAD
jgi:porin